MKRDVLPQFIITGGQKCATTYLSSVLRQHPDIFCPRQEIPFFQKPDYNPNLIEEYFNNINKEKNIIFGIKRPNYLGDKGVEKRIARHIPDVKLIVILRNPINRLKSAYFHYMKTGFLPLVALNKGVELLLDNKFAKNYPRSKELVEYGFYSKHIQRYLKHFPRENLKILLFEDLTSDPKKTISGVFKFLGVSNERSFNYSIRLQKGIYSMSRLRLRNYILPLLYKYNKNRTRLNMRKGPVGFMGRSFVALDALVLSRVYKQKPAEFNKSVRKRLIKIYEKDVRQLEKLLNTDLPGWLK